MHILVQIQFISNSWFYDSWCMFYLAFVPHANTHSGDVIAHSAGENISRHITPYTSFEKELPCKSLPRFPITKSVTS